jgi:SAM-dependent methyltransferase
MLKELRELAIKYGYDPNHNLRYAELADLVKKYDIRSVLVLGCGKGVLELILPDYVFCTSVDIDPKEVAIAKSINSGKINRDFVVADITRFPGGYENKFEAVIVSEVIEHLQDDKSVVWFVRRFLKNDNGLFLLSVPNIRRLINRINPFFGRGIKFMSDDHLREYDTMGIRKLLHSCEFDVLETRYVYFSFPKEYYVRKLISVDNPLRKFILKVAPKTANYVITVSRPSRRRGQ